MIRTETSSATGKSWSPSLRAPDIAVSLRERMELGNTDAVIEVGAEEVEDDLIPGSFIVSGILYSAEKHVKDFITKYIDEVRRA